jgi:hypothetical protein
MRKIKTSYFLFVIISIMFLGCSPNIQTYVIKSYENNFNCDNIALFGIKDSLPPNSEKIGKVRVRTPGFASDDSFEQTLVTAMFEAKKIGGNALRITHPSPSDYTTSEVSITAEIYRISPWPDTFSINDNDLSRDTSSVILHFYRPNQASSGAELYPILVNDSVVFLTLNSSSRDVKLHKTGLLKITTYFKSPESYESLVTYLKSVRKAPGILTGSSGSLTINVEAGKEYYIRCRGVDSGSALTLKLMRYDLGKFEYNLIE